MRIGIVGAGLAGLSAAYDLLAAGHKVTIFEASAKPGGLASGFTDAGWDWSVEKFYHHIFETDSAIIDLVEELGITDKMMFITPRTSMLYKGKVYPFSNPFDWFRFPGFNPFSFVRFGLVGALLRYTKIWRQLEKHTADAWTRRWYGEHIYRMMWRPLLIGKFGPYFDKANMAWLWARLYVRSFKLGTFEGGFETVVQALEQAVIARGGQIHYEQPVSNIVAHNGGIQMTAGEAVYDFDQALYTTSPGLLPKLAPELPSDYVGELLNLKSMGAVVLTLALNQQLMEDGTYWLNLPADTPDKSASEIPFVGLFEHTNFVDKRHFNGDHILYIGDYVTPDHRYMTMSQEELLTLFTQALTKFNPKFDRSWIRKSWLYRAQYAQPVPPVNHSNNVPTLRTPIPHLYFASMSHVYPWDRGTNFAVEIGRRVSDLMLRDATTNT